MPLESTMICLDNSDWMRNGDYVPTRLSAQQDAASMVCTQRIDSHPESTVGILTMAGKGVEVLASPTENIGKILATFAGIASGGCSELICSLEIAQLALKHRKNKNGAQRIIVFIGSPVLVEDKQLKKIGSLLKKNNIAVDVVVMGEHEEIQAKMTELVNAANTDSQNSHLIVVPPGMLPSDVLVTSPIFQGDGAVGSMGGEAGAGGGGGGGGGGDMFAEYGGIDPALDPELAMVMRASAEEARQQEEARMLAASQKSGEESKGSGSEESKGQENSMSSSAPPATSSVSAPEASVQAAGDLGGEEDEDDEEALLQAALAISLQDSGSGQEGISTEQPASGLGGMDEAEQYDDDDDLDEEMRLALAMSMEDTGTTSTTVTTTAAASSAPAVLLDADFVSQLLGSVDVDQSDPLIQAALQQMNGASGSGGAGGSNNEEEKAAGEKSDSDSGAAHKKRKEDER